MTKIIYNDYEISGLKNWDIKLKQELVGEEKLDTLAIFADLYSNILDIIDPDNMYNFNIYENDKLILTFESIQSKYLGVKSSGEKIDLNVSILGKLKR